MLNVLQSQSDDYVRVGQGTYGLASRGFEEVEGYPELIASVLKSSGGPMTQDDITERVSRMRIGKDQSIKMIIDMHPRFYRSLNGLYGLRAWLPPGKPVDLNLPEAMSETESSWRRVGRAQAKNYNVDRIIALDLEPVSA